MVRGMYAAATALDSASRAHDVMAQNLANINTPGYRAQGTVNETFDQVLGRATSPAGDLLGTHVAGVYHDFKPGPVQQTGHPFDLALESAEGFFVLNTPSGPVYTRNGSFGVTPQGRMVNAAGYAVQGTGGTTIDIPPGATVSIGRDGTVVADGVPAGRIAVVRFTNPERLEAAGPTLFRAPTNAGIAPADTGILQGRREGSNVTPADAMVKLISGQRYFEAAQRALRAISDSIQLNTRPQ